MKLNKHSYLIAFCLHFCASSTSHRPPTLPPLSSLFEWYMIVRKMVSVSKNNSQLSRLHTILCMVPYIFTYSSQHLNTQQQPTTTGIQEEEGYWLPRTCPSRLLQSSAGGVENHSICARLLTRPTCYSAPTVKMTPTPSFSETFLWEKNRKNRETNGLVK